MPRRRPRRKPDSRERVESEAREVESAFLRKRAEARPELEDAIRTLHGERGRRAQDDARS